MFQNLKRLILGIPAAEVSAAEVSAAETVRFQAPDPTARRSYRPASELSEIEIAGGVGENGDCWQAWRVDAAGQQWFRRIDGTEDSDTIPEVSPQTFQDSDSLDAGDDDSQIHGIDAGDFEDYGELDEYGLPVYIPPSSPAEALRNVRLRQAARAVAARNEAYPLEFDDNVFEDSDDDE